MIQKLKDTLFPHIGNISIGVGLTGLIAHLIHILFLKKPDAAVWLFALYPIQIEDYIGHFLFRGYFGPKVPSLVLILFSIMLIVGGILYKKTGGKDGRLLRFGYSVIAVHKGISVLSIPLNYLFFVRLIADAPPRYEPQKLPDFQQYVYFMFPALIFSVLAYYITRWLVEEQKMRVYTETDENGAMEYVYYPVSRKRRFAHWFFDLVMALLIVSPLVFLMFKAWDTHWRSLSLSEFRMSWLMSGALIVSLSLYYLLFEGIFNATPAKFITGCRVLDAENFERPTFGTIFLRTICRRIPFELFSFLGKRGWHDRISGTVVVEEDDFGQKRSHHVIWGILFVLIYAGGFGYRRLMQEYVSRQESALYDEAREHTIQVTAHLQPGDLLHASLVKYQREAADLLLEIEKSDQDSFYCMASKMERTYELDWNSIRRVRASAQYVGEIALSKAQVAAFTEKNQPFQFEFDQEAWALKDWLPVHFADITGGGASYSEVDGTTTGRFRFRFKGPSIEIQKGNVVSGNVIMTTTFPIRPHYDETRQEGGFELQLEQIRKLDRNMIELTVLIEGREQVYVVKGIGTQWVVYPKG